MAGVPYKINTSPESISDGNPCGCRVVTFDGRCALAVPCDRHVGKMEFFMYERGVMRLAPNV